VRTYTQCSWILLYIQRWLEATAQLEDGTLVPRTKGTPQGGVVSPLVANMFLHLAFDHWMRRAHPDVPFERYADDIVAHCGTETQAQQVLESIRRRLAQCRLELHPAKTRIVYKDDDRPRRYPQERFDFLGYTFRPRRSKNRWGKFFINFTPAASTDAMTKMRQEMRRWRLPVRSDKAIDDLARMWNPALRGWIQLRALLQVRVVPGLPSLQRPSGPLGQAEIQAPPPAPSTRCTVARRCGRTGAEAVCPLVSPAPTAGRPDDGSR
jgi:RNA-directed DNA polymerase